MADVDGRFDDADGRSKVFVRRREDESDEDFAARAMNILFVMSDLLPIERVVMSGVGDWQKLPTTRWLEARHRTYPTIHLRVTILQSDGGGSVGHLVVGDDDQQAADEWGDSQGGVYLPRSDDGRISKWQLAFWRLVHEIQGMADQFDSALERSGLVAESW